MLRSVRELEKLKVTAAEGAICGRIKDLYFDDHTWRINQIVFSLEPRQFGQQQVLVNPAHLNSISWKDGAARLNISASEVALLPLASSVRPVCKQYASLAFGSLASRLSVDQLYAADPHLRSSRAVMAYQICSANSLPGHLTDFLFDDQSWEIRYLAVEQNIDGRILRFHILPQSVERFTWATQRIVLRDLQPVRQDTHEQRVDLLSAA